MSPTNRPRRQHARRSHRNHRAPTPCSSHKQEPEYQHLRKIGAGGEGESHLLLHSASNTVTVCKTISSFTLSPRIHHHNLPLEVDILQNILRPHPRILPLQHYDTYSPGIPGIQHLWLYTPYCSLGDLGDYVPDRGNFMPEEHIWHVFIQMAEALAYLHHGYTASLFFPPPHWQPIIHRDIKPGNIFLRPSSNPSDSPFPDIILGDFGLASLESITYDCSGTPAYLPPEQYNSAAGDVWGLGSVIHELVHGMPPLLLQHREKGDSEEWLYQAESKFVREMPQGYSRELNECMMESLRWEPADRIDSFALLGMLYRGYKEVYGREL